MLRISPVEVRRGPQRSESRRLRSGEATALRLSPVEVRQGPPRSRAGSGVPARPTAIKGWQMSPARPCDQELADEIRRGPLRSRAGSRGRARPTAIKSWQRRSGEEKEGRKGQLEGGAAHLT